MTNLRKLRQLTHHTVSLKDCNAALEQAHGDVSRAMKLLEDEGRVVPKKQIDFPRFSGAPPERYYVLYKAHTYLKLGPDIYRERDALGMPPAEWDEEILAEIESCFQQLLDGKGWDPNDPLENVSVGGLYRAAETLHTVDKYISTCCFTGSRTSHHVISCGLSKNGLLC